MAFPPTAATVTSALTSYPAVYYDRVAVEALQNNLHLYSCIEKKAMPDKSGVVMQIFGYTKLAANTVAATDGTPQSVGVALTASTASITLAQYIDYVSYSDKIILTGISPVVAEGGALLGYRGALTVDKVISTAVDTVAAADSATRIDVAHGSFFTAAIARKAAMQLRSVDGKPREGALFSGVIYSLMAFDLLNDSAAGGWIDLMKYTDGNAGVLQTGVNPASQHVATVGGIRFVESNSLPTTTSFASTSVTGYHAYVFAKDAFFGASLGQTALGEKNFAVMQKTYDGTNSLDPAGQIRAASVYNFYFGLTGRPQSAVNVFRRIRAESSIG
jgi:N4-gp56 family major capsid protein